MADSSSTLQNQADALGITVDQLQKLMDATSTPTGSGSQVRTQNYGGTGYAQPQDGQSQTYQGAGGTPPSSGQSRPSDFQNISTMLGALKQAGISLGQGGQSGQQAANPTSASMNTGSGAGLNLAARMGAAALGSPEIINQQPNQGTMTSGGIFQGGQTQVSSDVPTMPTGPWSTTPGVVTQAVGPLGVTGAQAQSFWAQAAQKAGYTNAKPSDIDQETALKYYAGQHPQTAPLPGTPTPTMPAFAASGTGQPTPWANAPAAPGASAGGGQDFMAAHNAALADAGKAFYAHLTGNNPNTATPQDIADLHTTLANHVAQYTAGANPSAPGTAPPAAAQPFRASSGGLVPGRGHRDTVPALLTPGEYVLNQAQTAQLFGGRSPIRMQSGGIVPDDDQDQPPEVRRKPLTTGNTGATSASQSRSSAPAAPGSPATAQRGVLPGAQGEEQRQLAEMMAARTMRQNAALSANTPAYPAATTPAAQDYAAAANAGQVGGTAPSAAEISGAAGMSPAQTQAGIAQANMPAAGTAVAIGGLGSALAQAAKTYADSVGSWKMQSSSPMMYAGANRTQAPAAEFSQQPSPEGQRQGSQTSQANSLADYYKNYFPFMT